MYRILNCTLPSRLFDIWSVLNMVYVNNKRSIKIKRYKPYDKYSKVQCEHVKPVNAVDFKNGFLCDHHANNDEDEGVCYVGQGLPKSAITNQLSIP